MCAVTTIIDTALDKVRARIRTLASVRAAISSAVSMQQTGHCFLQSATVSCNVSIH